MKTNNFRALFVTGCVTFGAITGISFQGQAQVPAQKVIHFQQEKSDITRDVANIQLQREKIAALEQKCKDADKADNATAEAVAMKELRKEKADLAMYKAYLRADKIELMDDHNIAIKQRKQQLKENKCTLKEARKQLDNNLKQGDEASASKSAVAVAKIQSNIEQDRELLRQQKITRNEDIIAVNDIIRKSDGQNAGILKIENTMATTMNRMEK